MRVIRYEEKEDDKIRLIIKGEMIEEVSDFKYLGVTESATGKMEVEITKRITHMRIAYSKYKEKYLRIGI